MAHSAYEPRSLNDDCKKAGEPKNERLQRQKNQAGESKPSSLQIPNLSICSAAASYTANTSEVMGAVTTTTCQEDRYDVTTVTTVTKAAKLPRSPLPGCCLRRLVRGAH